MLGLARPGYWGYLLRVFGQRCFGQGCFSQGRFAQGRFGQGRLSAALGAVTILALAGCAPGQFGNSARDVLSAGQGHAVGAVAANDGAANVVRNQVYATRDTGPLSLDLYQPQGAGPHPLIVYVHGGAWESGNRSLDQIPGADPEAPLEAQELIRRGYAVATVDYPLSNQATFPTQPQDVHDAVAWLQQNSARFGIDPHNVGLWGISAGGQLVSLVGMDPKDYPLTGIRTVVSWAGPTDLTVAYGPRRSSLAAWAAGSIDKELGCAPANPCPAAAQASPIRFVSADSPPFLAEHGTADHTVPFQQSQAIVDALHGARGVAELHSYAGVDHDFAPAGQLPEIIRSTADFLGSHLQS
jgi:acetyl esterase/lipase